MKKLFFSLIVAFAAQFSYAGDHVIIVADEEKGSRNQTEVILGNDDWTETINVITGDEVAVLLKDLDGNIIYSFSLTAEETGGYPVTIPSLSDGWYVEIWVNNKLVYSYYE